MKKCRSGKKTLDRQWQATRSKPYLTWVSAMDEIASRQEKVRKFEEFVDRRLKPDLVKAVAQRDKVFQQQKVLYPSAVLLWNLEKNGVTSLRTMVNLGSEVFMQADVPDTRHIFVDIGMGFHVEFTWSEALEFISVRESRLAKYLCKL
ncbi:hypothetical protein IEQ34_020989 [Dendrobium chrysotoxum]|uniref:Protein UXT n=1 Tax=Dendrobium chrysotoxum TaxID=161865 RepID=A0AAV7G288_DENCH|nr:hypothetical protein IEQ34_020989 [Dendrobium chrysotoxum]